MGNWTKSEFIKRPDFAEDNGNNQELLVIIAFSL